MGSSGINAEYMGTSNLCGAVKWTNYQLLIQRHNFPFVLWIINPFAQSLLSNLF